jgi:acyl-CoA dehydrogenase
VSVGRPPASKRGEDLPGRLLRWVRERVPSLSDTEREALAAGTVWWEASLFRGRPDWDRLLAAPAARLSLKEQAFLDGPVEALCHMLDDWRITAEDLDLPPPVWRFLKTQGFFGLIIPRQYGGLEFSAAAHSAVVMKVASRSLTAAVTVMVPSSLGPAELLLRYGTADQRDYYLPRLARGEEIPCFALTGPEAGSDASALPDRGVVCRGLFRGSLVLGIRLQWEKRYITLAPVATVAGLAFRLYDPDNLLGRGQDLGITVALIPLDTPGVVVGRRHLPLSSAFQNGPITGHDVFVPVDWIIGGAERAGQGWHMLMESLAAGRGISLPALSSGAAKLASRVAGAHARVREQFGLPIGRFEGVQETLARIGGYTYTMDAVRRLMLAALHQGERPAVLSALVKYHCTELMRRVVNDAMDIQGGAGICLGPRNLLGRVYEALPIGITVEGANILTRSMIVFGQGALRCHPYLLAELNAVAMADARSALKAFLAALLGHAGFTARTAARTFALTITGGRLARVPKFEGRADAYFRRIERLSAAFALVADVAAWLLGGGLKRREMVSGRLADAFGELCLCAAALKRFRDDGAPEADLPLLRWACEQSLYEAQQALDGVLLNFPTGAVGSCLRMLVFPVGRPYSPPSDQLCREVAGTLLRPSEVRSRLTEGIFVPTERKEPLGRLEEALSAAVSTEPLARKLKLALKTGRLAAARMQEALGEARALGILSADEAADLERYLLLRREVIQVDDFLAPRAGGAVRWSLKRRVTEVVPST